MPSGFLRTASTVFGGVITMEMLTGYEKLWNELRDYAWTARRNGAPLIEDIRVRERLARTYANMQLMRLANLRLITRYMRGDAPGAETSVMKLHWVEVEQGLSDLSLALAGPDGLAMRGSPRCRASCSSSARSGPRRSASASSRRR